MPVLLIKVELKFLKASLGKKFDQFRTSLLSLMWEILGFPQLRSLYTQCFRYG
jgi:hypothetical protein